MKKSQVFIDSMAFKGYGVARMDGKVVFIPFSMVGDKAKIEIIREKKDYAIGKLDQLIESSPWRVDPPCPSFGQCGGCQWQHIDDSIQGEFKGRILKEILKKLGKLRNVPSIQVFSSSEPYRYRTRIQLRVKGNSVGYFQEKTHHLVDIDHCPISHPLINQIIRFIRQALPSFSQVREIGINVSPEEGKGVLIIHSHFFDSRLKNFLKEWLRACSLLKGLVIEKKGGVTLFGDPHLNFTIPLNQHKTITHLKLRTSSDSFFQVNLKQNQTLIQTVLRFSETNPEERILDLYAGVGNLTFPSAMGAKEAVGIEENRIAVEDAQLNAKRNGIKNCSFLHGRVEDVLKHLERGNPDLIVLDPPRKGCKTVLDQFIRLKPKKMVYVSCEPTTFARDLHLLSERGYHLQRLALIDMFPQTYHMEVVGLLTH